MSGMSHELVEVYIATNEKIYPRNIPFIKLGARR